jgi:hypothetical protein
MVEKIKSVMKRSRFAALSLLFALTVSSGGAVAILQPQPASAAACDKVNIVFCGLTGSGVSGNISSFQALYARGSDNGHNDLRQVFRWAGATDAMVAGMNTSNTQLGTLFRNGDIRVNGNVVGHDSFVAARFTEGAGFTQISNGVWARKTTTSFAEASSPVLVHTGANGSADFAVMTNCGNAVRFTPQPQPQPQPKPQPQPQPQPKPQPKPASKINCVQLTATEVGSSKTFVFHATATTQNVTIHHFAFEFGDNVSDAVVTSATSATTRHTYMNDNVSYVARVTVFAKDGQTDSNGACTVQVHTPAKPVAVQPQPQPQAECKPGVPEGSAECNKQPAVLGATTTPTPPAAPTPVAVQATVELPHTGASVVSVIGLFGATTVAGTMLHRLVMRRRMS